MQQSRSLIALMLLILIVFSAHAQEEAWSVRGNVIDASDTTALVGATVLMINIKDSTRTRFAVTENDGSFVVSDLEQAFYRLQISSVGYKTYRRVMRLTVPEATLGTLSLEQYVKVLDEISVEGEVVPMEQLGDTTQYNADAFKTNPDASATDLVSKMPGIVVDGDGVSANGESIEQVLLDGKRFFGQDPLLSLNTIPADMVDKIQVYDEESDQAQLTGFDDGNTIKTMNVVTKEDRRNGQFGKAYAGYGTENLYEAGVTINSFNQDQRITLLGMTNNINQQNFGSEDLAQVSGGRGSFRRGGGDNNFITGVQDGITRTHSLGINFTDSWGEKATFEGSYFFNQTNNSSDQLLSRESSLATGQQFYDQNQRATTKNLNHRLNTRIDYQINDNNNLLLRSAISYQNNQSSENTSGQTTLADGELLSETDNNYSSLNQAYSISNDLIYQHKFSKIGRTISLEVNSRISPTRRESYLEDLVLDSLTEYLTDEGQYTLGSSVVYTEPIGTLAQLAMKYEVSHTSRQSDRDTYTLQEGDAVKSFSEVLSNDFTSGYTIHSPSVRYSIRQFGSHFNAELGFQRAILSNRQFLPTEGQSTRHFNSLLPSITSRFELSDNANLFVRYATSTTEPSVSQLQGVLDNSDPLFLSVGNPNLDQTYSHSLRLRFQKNNVDRNTSLANFTNVTASSDYISNSTTIVSEDSISAGGIVFQEGAQLTTPVNLDGYWNVQNNTTYGVLISPLKSNLNASIGLGYQRLPGMINDEENIANAYSANARVGLASNISEKIDYNIYYQINGSRVLNSLQSGSNSQYYTQTLGAKLNLIFGKGFVFRNETYFQRYTGANDQFDTDYTLWNMGIAKKFLKDDRGELELSVFDLLGQNQSFDQTVSAQYLEETQTEVLQRYFMLTFTYQLRRFEKGSS
ncbi:TonB-dependent receptor [Tunicatimonas pelagia]|uniref:TonB-dependent receptor n=1 Tax=Tunicatimonas pelagia TaxID=931531 RepID=UPI002666DE6A|nr:TonB-dependent receptor [Tunicatimonas pelagia]WKN42739.1 TonB-dependent receptor [Tunicatimonas pelagia]